MSTGSFAQVPIPVRRVRPFYAMMLPEIARNAGRGGCNGSLRLTVAMCAVGPVDGLARRTRSRAGATCGPA